MTEEIEFIELSCGHYVNAYVGLGHCTNCGKKCCAKCLQLIDSRLLCPDCFTKCVERCDCG